MRASKSDRLTAPAAPAVPVPRPSDTGAGADYETAATLTARAMRSSGTTEHALAYASGVCRARVRAWLEPERLASLSVARLCHLAGEGHRSSFVLAVARELSELAEPTSRPGLAPLAHVARLADELGQVARAVTEALADGQLDENELARIERELGHIEAAAAAARRDLGR